MVLRCIIATTVAVLAAALAVRIASLISEWKRKASVRTSCAVLEGTGMIAVVVPARHMSALAAETVASAFDTASCPLRVRAIVVDEVDGTGVLGGAFAEVSKYISVQHFGMDGVRVLTLPAALSGGPLAAAKEGIQNMSSGEKWMLLTRPGTTFAPGWDETCVRQASAAGPSYVVTCHPSVCKGGKTVVRERNTASSGSSLADAIKEYLLGAATTRKPFFGANTGHFAPTFPVARPLGTMNPMVPTWEPRFYPHGGNPGDSDIVLAASAAFSFGRSEVMAKALHGAPDCPAYAADSVLSSQFMRVGAIPVAASCAVVWEVDAWHDRDKYRPPGWKSTGVPLPVSDTWLHAVGVDLTTGIVSGRAQLGVCGEHDGPRKYGSNAQFQRAKLAVAIV